MTLAKYGRYETLHRIAAGGMASVYLGRHVGAGGFERLVAIKVMHEHIAEDPAFSAMFLDEARLAAQIRHPNVVPTLDVAEDGTYIVMEYIEGASLQAIGRARRKAKAGPIPTSFALRIFLDVLAGLEAAHELVDTQGQPLNLVHRDISPHNVLVGVDGMSRITDFGIAFAEARLTSTKSGQLKGKLPYMAPEQLEDASVTRATDVYAAGCVLWEMLAGERLFQGSSEAAVACAVLAGPERSLSDVRPDLPAELDRVCMKALQRVEDRFPTALAFAEALEDAADSVGLTVARHRKVGAVAQLEEMTYPAASTLTESDDDPRPPEAMAAAQKEAGAPSTARTVVTSSPDEEPDAAAEPVATEQVTKAPVTPMLGSQTLQSEPTASEPGDVGRTTTDDRPPPEVAAVIRAAYESQAGAPVPGAPVPGAPVPGDSVTGDSVTGDPVTGDAEGDAAHSLALDETVVIPKQRTSSSVLAAVALFIGLGGGILWAATRDDGPAASSATDPVESSASSAVDAPSSAAKKVPTASVRDMTPPAGTAAGAAGEAAAGVAPPAEAPAPRAPSSGTRAVSGWPRPITPPPRPSPPPKIVEPKNNGGEYHPDAP